MRLTTDDQEVLAALEARSEDLVRRAVDWCAISSGSRNDAGLQAQRAVLAEALRRLPGEVDAAAFRVARGA